jgi:hypothetical protein
MRGEAGDEQQCGLQNDLVISRLVLGEPLPVIVPFQLPQEFEQLGSKVGGVGHLAL